MLVIEAAQPSAIAPIVVEAYDLTPHEQEIISLIARGAGTPQIADELILSRHTVRDHVKAIFAKVGVTSRGELVAKLFADFYEPAHNGADITRTTNEPPRADPSARSAAQSGLKSMIERMDHGHPGERAEFTHRLATMVDRPALDALAAAAIEVLQRGYLRPDQIAASRGIMGIDARLIDDGTYFVVEAAARSPAAAGGAVERRSTAVTTPAVAMTRCSTQPLSQRGCGRCTRHRPSLAAASAASSSRCASRLLRPKGSRASS